MEPVKSKAKELVQNPAFQSEMELLYQRKIELGFCRPAEALDVQQQMQAANLSHPKDIVP